MLNLFMASVVILLLTAIYSRIDSIGTLLAEAIKYEWEFRVLTHRPRTGLNTPPSAREAQADG